ncbi:MAG: hybrid sensor histidine kinase/response regulator [Deltaproteobacteria bacterium]|nr:MAG: hybrid sensor histidine kinase/response regulator [Deltaproteobacteria bacterium]
MSRTKTSPDALGDAAAPVEAGAAPGDARRRTLPVPPFVAPDGAAHPATDRMRDAFWVASAGWTRLIVASAAFERILGVSREEVMQEPERLRKVVHPDDLDRVVASIAEIHRTGAGELEYRIVRPDGQVRWVHSRAFVQPGPDGSSRMIGFTSDVTERRSAEAALRESETRFRTLFEHAFEAIFVFDPDARRFIDCNPSAVRLLGLSREALLELGPEAISAPVQVDGHSPEAHISEKLEQVLSGQHLSFDWVLLDAEGQERHCQVHLTRLPVDGRRLLRASVIDVTETRRLEAQLRHAQRLEAVGRLAGGIAHDFNNVLSVIVASADLVRRHLGDASPALAHLEDIHAAADRAAALTRQLLAFSRRQVLAPRVVDLRRTVEQLRRLIERLIGEDIEVHYALPDAPMPVEVDVAQVEQVLLNLAVNARDAMPGGGHLSIELSHAFIEAGASFEGEQPAEGAYVRLSVSDDGCGMEPEVLAHIFEPFYTTKAPGQGSGLGLSTVYGIVKQSGGYIRVRSQPRIGTRFDILFPRSPKAIAGSEPEEPRRREEGMGGWILVVEDDDLLRRVVRRMLEAAGYSVLSAANANEAVAAVRREGVEIRLVLTDVVMPGRSGPELVEQLARELPEVKVLFMSGYIEAASERRLPQGARVLKKPFTQAELLEAVREGLEAGAAAHRPAADP